MKIKELPFKVIWQLCMYLDRIDQPGQNWKAVLANVQGEAGTAIEHDRAAPAGLLSVIILREK